MAIIDYNFRDKKQVLQVLKLMDKQVLEKSKELEDFGSVIPLSLAFNRIDVIGQIYEFDIPNVQIREAKKAIKLLREFISCVMEETSKPQENQEIVQGRSVVKTPFPVIQS